MPDPSKPDDVARAFAQMADADWAAYRAAVAAVMGQSPPVDPLPPRRWREGRSPGQDCRRAMADLARSHTDDPDERERIDEWFGVVRGGGVR